MVVSLWIKIILQNTDTTDSNSETISRNSELHVRKQQGNNENPTTSGLPVSSVRIALKISHVLKMRISA